MHELLMTTITIGLTVDSQIVKPPRLAGMREKPWYCQMQFRQRACSLNCVSRCMVSFIVLREIPIEKSEGPCPGVDLENNRNKSCSKNKEEVNDLGFLSVANTTSIFY